MSVRTIEQKITAASDFNGVLPTTTKVLEFDMERFPTDTVGGLFDFENSNPLQVHQVLIKFGGQTTWSLVIVDVDTVETTLASGTTEAELLVTNQVGPLAQFILLEGQALKLVTSGASAAMVARISVN